MQCNIYVLIFLECLVCFSEHGFPSIWEVFFPKTVLTMQVNYCFP